MKNIMEKLNAGNVDRRYALSLEEVFEIATESENEIIAISRSYKWGYLQGCKATKAEMRRKEK